MCDPEIDVLEDRVRACCQSQLFGAPMKGGMRMLALWSAGNTGDVPPDRWAIYAHHPPLLPLLIAGWQRLAGISEWTARTIPSLFSVASTLLLSLMAARRFSARVAVATGVLYAFCPLTLVFGGMPEYVGAQLVFFGLATVESYVRWAETGRARWLAAVAVTFLLGALTDWPIVYLVPGLCAYHLLTHPRRALVSLAPLLAAASLLFVALVP
jgi:4-amino-4-deoxy-L-arabinose transferase-like glycosyltransferase